MVRTWFGCVSDVVRRWLGCVFGPDADSLAEVKGKWFPAGLSVLRATADMRDDEEVIQAALAASPDDLVGLRVFLLSGRSCNHVFSCHTVQRFILRT